MIQKPLRAMASVLAALILTVAGPGSALADHRSDAEHFQTQTPIKHIVVIFQENVSFDHYFGTYPRATTRRESTTCWLADCSTKTRIQSNRSAWIALKR